MNTIRTNNKIEHLPWIALFAVALTVILAAIGAGNGSDENSAEHQCRVHFVCQSK